MHMKRSILTALLVAAVQVASAALRVGIVDACATNGVLVGQAYLSFVTEAGAEPVLLRATEDKAEIARLVDGCDALLFTGGEDVEPSRYGEKPSPRLGRVNKRRDAWEFAVLDAAVPKRKPLFGICRGCQLLNVYFGGTLWQDLPSEFPGCAPRGHRLKDGSEHEVKFEAGSLIAKRTGLSTTTVNSYHHQAVKAPGRGFRVVARSVDGVVEAIENADYPAVGVQFHPEKMLERRNRRDFLPLLAPLVEQPPAR